MIRLQIGGIDRVVKWGGLAWNRTVQIRHRPELPLTGHVIAFIGLRAVISRVSNIGSLNHNQLGPLTY